MICWLLGLSASDPLKVSYGSAVQIKSLFTKNRLIIEAFRTSDNYDLPTISTSRPPFKPGWQWLILPSNGTDSLFSSTVHCGEEVLISGLQMKYYLTVEPPGVIKAGKNPCPWKVQCLESDIWTQDTPIQLYSPKLKCFLFSSMEIYSKVNKGVRYMVNCSSFASETIWKASEGVYFASPEADPEHLKSSEL